MASRESIQSDLSRIFGRILINDSSGIFEDYRLNLSGNKYYFEVKDFNSSVIFDITNNLSGFLLRFYFTYLNKDIYTGHFIHKFLKKCNQDGYYSTIHKTDPIEVIPTILSWKNHIEKFYPYSRFGIETTSREAIFRVYIYGGYYSIKSLNFDTFGISDDKLVFVNNYVPTIHHTLAEFEDLIS